MEARLTRARWKAQDRIAVALVLISTGAVYVRTLKFDFVFDDRVFIIENPFLRSWRFVPHYFTHHLTSHVAAHSLSSYYRPVLLLWLRLNYALFHLSHSWWHASTLALYLVVTLAVYFLARRLLGDPILAGIAAFIFALHPVHVESVAWVMGFPDSLLAALLVFSFLCYLRSRDGRTTTRPWLATSLGLYGLAILVKEPGLVLPALVFAYEWVYRPEQGELSARGAKGRRLRVALVSVAPYLALTAAYLVARVFALKGLTHPGKFLPLQTVVFTWPSVLWFYCRLLVWPFGLSGFYDQPYVRTPGLANFVLPGVALAALGFGLWLWARRSRTAAFAIAWLILPLLPALNLSVFPEGELVHDRYLYLSSIGFTIWVALALRRLSAIAGRFVTRPVIQPAAVLTLIISLAFATARQTAYWRNNMTLYGRGVAVAPHSNMARNNLANEFQERGLYSQAIGLYQQVLADDSGYWLSNYNLGFVYYKTGDLAEAERYLRRAIEISSSDPDQFVYLGLTRLKQGQLDDAAAFVRHAIALRPDGTGYHFALGMVMKMKGDLPAAIQEFKAELTNDPQQNAAREQINEIEARLGHVH